MPRPAGDCACALAARGAASAKIATQTASRCLSENRLGEGVCPDFAVPGEQNGTDPAGSRIGSKCRHRRVDIVQVNFCAFRECVAAKPWRQQERVPKSRRDGSRAVRLEGCPKASSNAKNCGDIAAFLEVGINEPVERAFFAFGATDRPQLAAQAPIQTFPFGLSLKENRTQNVDHSSKLRHTRVTSGNYSRFSRSASCASLGNRVFRYLTHRGASRMPNHKPISGDSPEKSQLNTDVSPDQNQPASGYPMHDDLVVRAAVKADAGHEHNVIADVERAISPAPGGDGIEHLLAAASRNVF